jgi:hypothetical protein
LVTTRPATVVVEAARLADVPATVVAALEADGGSMLAAVAGDVTATAAVTGTIARVVDDGVAREDVVGPAIVDEPTVAFNGHVVRRWHTARR